MPDRAALDVLDLAEQAEARLRAAPPPEGVAVSGALAEAAERGGPSIRILPGGEAYAPGRAVRVGAIQRASLRLLVIHEAPQRNTVRGEVTGAGARTDGRAAALRDVRDFSRGLLAGWQPEGGDDTLQLRRAETGLRTQAGRAWWTDEYEVTSVAAREQSRVEGMEAG